MKTRKLIKYGITTSIATIFIIGLTLDLGTAIWVLAQNGEDSLFITGYIIGRTALLATLTTLLVYYAKNYLQKEKEQ